MGQVKEKTIVVKSGEEDVTVVIKSPTPKVISDSQRKGAVVWANCIKDGVLTKDELEIILEKRGIWSEAHEEKKNSIVEEITKLERKLFIANKSRKMPAEQGRQIALSMREKRDEIRELMAKRLVMEANTAEALSENAKFDFIVSQCVFDENGENFYEDEQDYALNSDGPVAFKAAQELATMMYSLEEDYESKLPENVYLKEFNHVDENLRLINKDGNFVDSEGRLINDEGHFVNEDGERVDKDGYKLDENGMYLNDQESSAKSTTETETESQTEPTSKKKKKKI